MIVQDNQFDKIEKFLEDSEREIDYIVLHLELDKSKSKVQEYFVPIYSDEKVKKPTLEHIFSHYFGVVIYDRNRFKVNNDDAHMTFLDVLDRKVGEQTYERILDELEKNNIHIDSYESLPKLKETIIRAISDALNPNLLLKKLLDGFKTLNKEFLTKKEALSLVQRHEEFDKQKYNKFSARKQREYINSFYPHRINEVSISKHAVANIDTILKSVELSNILRDYFISSYEHNIVKKRKKDDDGEQVFKKEVQEYPLFQNTHSQGNDKEGYDINFIYKQIYDYLETLDEQPIHKNAPFYYLEALRNIKYVNLYELDDSYGTKRNQFKIQKMFEKMKLRRLCSLELYQRDNSSYVDYFHYQVSMELEALDNFKYEHMKKIVIDEHNGNWNTFESSGHKVIIEDIFFPELQEYLMEVFLDEFDDASNEHTIKQDINLKLKSMNQRDSERLENREIKRLKKKSEQRSLGKNLSEEFQKTQKQKHKDEITSFFDYTISDEERKRLEKEKKIKAEKLEAKREENRRKSILSEVKKTDSNHSTSYQDIEEKYLEDDEIPF